MKEYYAIQPSTGKRLNLTKYSVQDLYRLHFTEEKFVADKILQMPAFSAKRDEYLSENYKFIRLIQECRNRKEHKACKSYGANPASVGMVKNIIKEENRNITLYEAGVGSGFAVDQYSKMAHVRCLGCDLVISEKVEKLMQRDNVFIEKSGIWGSIRKQQNNSIDIFYADNVFEHLLPDERDKIYSEISTKLKKNSVVILFIPNRYVGPNDISGKFLKMGQKAQGFHFSELSYGENCRNFRKTGIGKVNWICIRKKGIIIKIYDRWGILNRIKILMEPVLGILPPTLRKWIFNRLCYDIYIIKRESNK